MNIKEEIKRYEHLLAKADAESKRLAGKRAALGTNCTRAVMTTANAKWMRAAEERDRFAAKLDELKTARPEAQKGPVEDKETRK